MTYIRLLHACAAFVWFWAFIDASRGEPLATPEQWGPFVYWIEAEVWTGLLTVSHLIGAATHRAGFFIFSATACAIIYGAFFFLGWYGNATEDIAPKGALAVCLFLAAVAWASWKSLSQQSLPGSGQP